MESSAEHSSGAVRIVTTKWTRYSTSGKGGKARPTDAVQLGPGDVEGLDRRLLGDVHGLRVLELGTGTGNGAIALARQGARVVAIDPDPKHIASARQLADDSDVHVELHEGDLAGLAFLHADIFDAVVAVHSLAAVENLGRVFRQVHRVLKRDRPFVLTLPHPADLASSIDDYGSGVRGTSHMRTYPHSTTDVFTAMARSNYRVDTLLEPMGDGPHPLSLILRGKKLGN